MGCSTRWLGLSAAGCRSVPALGLSSCHVGVSACCSAASPEGASTRDPWAAHRRVWRTRAQVEGARRIRGAVRGCRSG